MTPRRIAFLGYDGVSALDLVGPSEAFASARIEMDGRPAPAYRVTILGATGESFRAESGIVFRAHRGLAGRPAIDTLIVPGGRGLRVPAVNARVAAWLRERAPGIRRIASVCTGIYGLAASGLLDGRRVTTHWRFARDVARRFPAMHVDPNALFVQDDRFYTSAGVTAGIDLALALIEEDLGREAALAVARELVVYLKRSGARSSTPSRCASRWNRPIRSPSSTPGSRPLALRSVARGAGGAGAPVPAAAQPALRPRLLAHACGLRRGPAPRRGPAAAGDQGGDDRDGRRLGGLP